jgi:acetyl esterase/lipase
MMTVDRINLYDYFGVEKPLTAVGNLEIYIPTRNDRIGINRKRPGALVLPGGGYANTSERESESVALKYVAEGYCAFVLRYSCKPNKYPLALQEAGMAMVYIRKNAEKFGVKEDNVFAIGFSAGGHLCGCLATMFDSEVLDFLGDKKSLVKPNACVLMYPVINASTHAASFYNLCGDDIALQEYLSLDTRVTKNSVPAYIFATVMDNCVAVRNSLLMACAYEKAGVPFSLHILEKGYHGLSVNDLTCDTAEALKQRAETTPKNYNDWIGQVFTWLKERGFTIITD